MSTSSPFALSPIAPVAGAAVDRFRPAGGGLKLVAFELLLVAVGTALIAGSAWVSWHPGFSPVPITGQTFAVLLVAALYGPVRGTATVLAYLAEGAMGLPVFAGGAAGVGYLLAAPTTGYLLGFVAAAAVTGGLAVRGWDRSFPRAVVAMSLGTAIIFVSGLAWLSIFLGLFVGDITLDAVLLAGLWPYLPGAMVKIGLAAALLPCGWAVLRWLDSRVR
ncbi:MAG: biotin transporter BioY [Phycisphaerales bacterium]